MPSFGGETKFFPLELSENYVGETYSSDTCTKDPAYTVTGHLLRRSIRVY